MKATIFTFLLLMLGTIAFAQAPKDGAIMSADDYALSVNAGRSVSTTVRIERSQRFSKVKFQTPVVSKSIDGLSFAITETGTSDEFTLIVKADANAASDIYNFLVEMPGKWSSKVPSILMSLQVEGNTGAVSSKN